MAPPDLETFLTEARPAPAANPLVALSRRLPQPVVQAARNGATQALAPLGRRRLPALLEARGGRLHLGCGFNHLEGWLNVDRVGARADVFWDLRRPLPLPAGSARAIFHEHLLEHIPFSAGLQFTKRCAQLLADGGILRIVVPDAGRSMRDYVARRPELLDRAPTPLLATQPLLSGFGHVAMYDAETLSHLLKAAGFALVEEKGFGESRLEPAPDDPARRDESLYIEAVR